MNVKCVWCVILLPVLLTACGYKQQNLDTIDMTNRDQLENLQYRQSIAVSDTKSSSLSSLKVKVLQDTAMSLGAQAGLAWASDAMNERMQRDQKYLDTIFNFNAMVLSHGVLPPVLEEGDFTLNLADPNTIRVADRTYRIVQQARFATTPPNWREYIWLTYSKPTLPDRSLLPKTNEEVKIWAKGIRMGWEKGIEQAYSIFHQNLARLKRDYNGMVLYRKLLQEKMISSPFVARTELGITGNGTDMRINDQVLRIVDLPKLQTSGKHWQAVVVKNQ